MFGCTSDQSQSMCTFFLSRCFAIELYLVGPNNVNHVKWGVVFHIYLFEYVDAEPINLLKIGGFDQTLSLKTF